MGLSGSAHICKQERLRLRPLNFRVMPIPKPKPNEDETQFMERCMNDFTMRAEFPDQVQRLAVCINSLKED